MPGYGFGAKPFGSEPYGDVNWCRVVLWDDLQENLKEDDRKAGYPYKKFVEGVAPSFEYLRRYIDKFKTITDPTKIREDLLTYFASNFGISIDLAEPEAYRRMRASLAAAWNIIKGTVPSYVVLCRVHGFEVDVYPLWWDGVEYSTSAPHLFNVTPTVAILSTGGGNTTYSIRVTGYPIEPGSITLDLRNMIGPVSTVIDDALGGWVGKAGTIDYGWGYMTITCASNYYPERIDFASVVGGCPDVYGKCKTHRLRLTVTPGSISGQSDLTVAEAFQRLYAKIGELTGDGVVPIHVTIEPVLVSATGVWNIGPHFDLTPADEIPVDSGLRWEPV